MYLITAKYRDDPERKRIEYVLEKWSQALSVAKLKDIAVIVDSEADEHLVADLVKDLYSRSSPDSVKLYRIEPTSPGIEQEAMEIPPFTLREKAEAADRILGFIMARQKAIRKPGVAEPMLRTYEVTSKKGKAEVMTWVVEKEGAVEIHVRITGFGPVVSYLHSKLTDELKFIRSQGHG